MSFFDKMIGKLSILETNEPTIIIPNLSDSITLNINNLFGILKLKKILKDLMGIPAIFCNSIYSKILAILSTIESLKLGYINGSKQAITQL